MGKVLNDCQTEIIRCIDAYNKALAENDFNAMNSIEIELKDAETAYADAQATAVYAICKAEENPILKAAVTHSYPVLAHKKSFKDEKFLGIELVEDRIKQIDLVKLCIALDLDTLWQYKVEKLNELLCMRAGKELGMTVSQLKKISTTFYMSEFGRKENLGETPDSNTQICALLQKILDAVLFVDNDKGKNVYRVNSHDVAYLLMCYTKRGRKTLSVSVSKNAYVHRLVMDVMHRIVTGKKYDIEYRMTTEKAVAVVNPEAPKQPVKKQFPEKETTETIVVLKPAKVAKPVKTAEVLPSVEELLNDSEATNSAA